MRSTLRSSVLVPLVALITSCAVGPHYQRPQPPPNAGYTPRSLPETSASAAIGGGEAQRFIEGQDLAFEWWQAFQSPALNTLVERALRNNPTIAAAQAA